MKEHLKPVCAVIGAAGAQILTFVMFALLAEPCPEIIPGLDTQADCLWGMTLTQYWASVGTIASACFAVIGWVLATELEAS